MNNLCQHCVVQQRLKKNIYIILLLFYIYIHVPQQHFILIEYYDIIISVILDQSSQYTYEIPYQYNGLLLHVIRNLQ